MSCSRTSLTVVRRPLRGSAPRGNNGANKRDLGIRFTHVAGRGAVMNVAGLAPPGIWLGFAILVVAVLAIDLGIVNRKAHVVKPREALVWTGVWVALALGFGIF